MKNIADIPPSFRGNEATKRGAGQRTTPPSMMVPPPSDCGCLPPVSRRRQRADVGERQPAVPQDGRQWSQGGLQEGRAPAGAAEAGGAPRVEALVIQVVGGSQTGRDVRVGGSI